VSNDGARLARARLIAQLETTARELDARAERLRRSLSDLSDATEHADSLAVIAQLTALAQLNWTKAERLRGQPEAADDDDH
jgi:hypothetical protein